jgi:hypothetical protein
VSGAARREADPAADDSIPWEARNREVMELGLAWLRTLLESHIAALRTAKPAEARSRSILEGAMSDLEADWLLRDLAAFCPEDAAAGSITRSEARAAFDAARSELRDAGEASALDRLSATFGLAPADEDLLLLAYAPRADAGFQALYGYAHDRMSIAEATPHLARCLLAPEGGEAARHLATRLGPDAPLRRFALLHSADGVAALGPLSLDERTARYLMGEDRLDPRVRAWLRPLVPGDCPERHVAAVDALAKALERAPRPLTHIVGPPRSGRRAVAAALAARFGCELVELDPRALPETPAERRAALALAGREARIQGFALLVDADPDTRTWPEERRHLAHRIAEEVAVALDALAVVIAEERLGLPVPPAWTRLTLLDSADRVQLWRSALGSAAAPLEAAIEAVAEQFALGPGDIAALAEGAPPADAAGLWAACREAAGRPLDELAERIAPQFAWDDIVLPAGLRQDLQAIVGQVRHRGEVYGRWGFAGKLPRGRGVAALFSGPSGTGKTMAAEVIAGDLQLDLHRIDLSGVVSKYIGETEKNLRRVFDAAETSGAVLFFDEADALFGKRSEVRDSHDRYANIEVSYLLQRMEAYSGLAILATNLKSHLDAAFLRRLRYVLDFPFPDAAMRREIWARAFPPQAPTSGLDLGALARLEVAGGNITVIAVNAAFLAAAEKRPIGMGHVTHAARAEFRKLDKEFRPTWPGGR